MSKNLPDSADSVAGDVVEKLRRSRKRLLDLTLRNRLLNFRPGNPNFQDDQKAYKHLVLDGEIEFLWQYLVGQEKQIEVVCLTNDQREHVAEELNLQSGTESNAKPEDGISLAKLGHEEWEKARDSIRGMAQFRQKGNLLSKLSSEPFRKRLTKIWNEQNTLANSTGDSALFLAIGFLEWCEAPPHPKADEPLFAPLILVHVNLDQRRTEGGGAREFLLQMDADEPQGNPCLAENLRQEFGIDLPDFDPDEDKTADDYFSRVGRALKTKKNWKIHPTIALGFFNFARYRLWLDLNPSAWPDGKSPTDHPIVSAILNGDPLPQLDGIPNEEEVSNHQETADLPIVMDSDSTQYAALLAGQKGVSVVIQGPPGSGKSQTITNLIAVALAAGKRVLFVAQKLPALQVVQRRLESVELASFCLPLFSDKARVTEMHKHFATSARLRESNYNWRRNLDNPVVAQAKKLNDHAARLRDQPTGFNQSACSLIQRATALHLMLREVWGNDHVILSHDLSVKLTVEAFDPEGRIQLKISEKILNDRLGGRMPKTMSLIPDEFVNPRPIPEAIADVAAKWESTKTLPENLRRLFLRLPPNLSGKNPSDSLVNSNEDVGAAAVRIVTDMQNSVLCIQGPPGCGKTTTASGVIVNLLKSAKKIGITSNSHKAIINLLSACNYKLAGKLQGIKAGGDGNDPIFTKCPGLVHVAVSGDAASQFSTGLIAGTAWLFARDDMVDKLDYLFVDEAGQVSLANLAGMSRCTRNVILMGDQMQLEQPIQGSHPGESGMSVLNYYLMGHATIPEKLGLFLGTSFRMHPDVCQFISEMVYESRLQAALENKNRVLVVPPAGGQHIRKPAGIIFTPVEHDGNTQGSEEEVERIKENLV